MTGYPQDWLQLAPPHPFRKTILGALSIFGSALFILDLLATIGDSSAVRPGLVLAVVVAPLAVMLWWAHGKAATTSRRPLALLASAATVWLAGLVLWQVFAMVGRSGTLLEPVASDAFLAAAQTLVIVALGVALGSSCSLRAAVMDTAVIAAAGLALGALFVRPPIGSPAALLSVSSPLLSLGALMLILSAALRSGRGVPLSIGILGLAQFPLTAGNLIYGSIAFHGKQAADPWASLAWGTGAIVAMLAASVVLLGIDRPVRLPVRSRIPNHAAGARPIILLFAFALTLPLGVACDGVLTQSGRLVLVGLIAGATIGVALALRASESLRTAEAAYRRLDRSLAESERSYDALVLANRELADANVQVRAMQVAFADLLNLADERTQGRMRELIEETGGELAALLEEQLGRR